MVVSMRPFFCYFHTAQNGQFRPTLTDVQKVLPKMEIEISLIAHSFDDLSTAARGMANMILERSLS